MPEREPVLYLILNNPTITILGCSAPIRRAPGTGSCTFFFSFLPQLRCCFCTLHLLILLPQPVVPSGVCKRRRQDCRGVLGGVCLRLSLRHETSRLRLTSALRPAIATLCGRTLGHLVRDGHCMLIGKLWIGTPQPLGTFVTSHLHVRPAAPSCTLSIVAIRLCPALSPHGPIAA